MNRGSQPTDRHALTGEWTPPGMIFFAWAKSCADRSVFIGLPCKDLAKIFSLLIRYRILFIARSFFRCQNQKEIEKRGAWQNLKYVNFFLSPTGVQGRMAAVIVNHYITIENSLFFYQHFSMTVQREK
jgi:hypothetical protein